MKQTLLGLSLLAAAATANAAGADIFKINGQYANVANANRSVTAGITVDGAGISQTAHLFYYVRGTATTPSIYWSGPIPTEAVTVTGVASMAVDVDTCFVNATDSCGHVAFTVETNEPATGWVNNGVWGYESGDFIVRYAGAWQVRSSSATGQVLGHDISNNNVYMGSVDDVTVEVQIGN